MRDVMKEESSNPAKKRPINCGESAAKERPLDPAIMSYCWVAMMEVGDHHNPMVRPLKMSQRGGDA
jgi:hypothetical protein